MSGTGGCGFFMGASVENICSRGGGRVTALSPRAVGGGELETWRPLRGEGVLVRACGGERSVCEAVDTSVIDTKASRYRGSYVLAQACAWGARGS